MENERPENLSIGLASQESAVDAARDGLPGVAKQAGRGLAVAAAREHRELLKALAGARADGSLSDEEYLSSRERLSELYGTVSPEEARETLGNGQFLGAEEVGKAFGVRLEDVPPIPFSREELENAGRLGQMLVLRVDKAADGEPLTMKKIQEVIGGKMEASGKGPLRYPDDWYKDEDLFTKERPAPGWTLTTKETVPGSASKDYIGQAEVMVAYLKDEVFAGSDIPPAYEEAIREFEEQKAEIAGLVSSHWQQASQRLADLKITRLTRKSAAETLYDMAVAFEETGERLLERGYSWTKTRSSVGYLVFVGFFDSDGALVSRDRPGYAYGGPLGVSFSRSL